MALGVCRECRKEVSESAGTCPHCGAPKPTAKRKPVSAGVGCLVIFVAMVVIGGIISSGENTRQAATPPPPPNPLALYRDSLTLEIVSWERGGFDNVMLADFRVANNGGRAVRDVTVMCRLTAESGTEVSVVDHAILREFPPGRTTRVNDVNMGFINPQSERAGCLIADFRF